MLKEIRIWSDEKDQKLCGEIDYVIHFFNGLKFPKWIVYLSKVIVIPLYLAGNGAKYDETHCIQVFQVEPQIFD